jgi:hypothetical protein
LSDFLKKNKHESIEITPIEATIEDCFMELMNTPPPTPSLKREGSGAVA